MKRAFFVALTAAACAAAHAQDRIADIRQGTNLAVAITPDGRTLVVDLLGQLWTLPAAGGGAVPLTPTDDVARQPRVSPDGSRVVYQRLHDDQWDLWLLDLASGDAEPLTTSSTDEREPDFTADGRAVVFAAERAGRSGLWSIDIESRVETPLASDTGLTSFPAVSEHGVVAYLSTADDEWRLRVRAADGAVATVYTSPHRLSPPSWRPGGGVLVFGEQDGPESSRLRLLLLAEPRVLKPLSGAEDLFAARAAWLSPAEFIYAADGQLWRRGIAVPVREPVHLFAAAAVAVAATPTDLPQFDAAGARTVLGINGLARSPDGRRSAFTALGDLWLAERDVVQRLTDDAFVDLDPTFWPDGDSVVFASERTGQLELWRFMLRDRRLTQLTFGALEPRRPAVSPDGNRIAYLASATLEPWAATTLKVLDWSAGNERTLATNVVGAAEVAWAEDGRTVRLGARSADAPGRDVLVEAPQPRALPDTRAGALPSTNLQWHSPAPPADYVVEIGRLFDGTRATYRRHVDVHVRGGRIAAIVGRGVLPSPGLVIDARDATVIPGLIDVHAHQRTLAGERLGRAWLAYGVTTVRELADDTDAALERAEAWASGRTPGPRLLITPAARDAIPPADANAPLRAYSGIAHGFAHSLGRQVAQLRVPPLGPYPRRLRSEVAAPSHELELSPGYAAYQDGVGRLVASGSTFVSGLAAIAGFDGIPLPRLAQESAYRALFTTVERTAWEQPDGFGASVPALERTIARLIRAGGRVAIGSDAPAVPYGLGVHLELALLAQAGVANDQILRMATIEGALALGLEQQLGTLEEGKLADFVVVNGDPLTHIADTLKIVAVAKGGTWYERTALLTTP